MIGFIYVVVLLVVCVGGCYWLFTSAFDLFVPKDKETYIDKTTHIHNHTHYYDNRSINVDGKEFKNLK